VCRQEALLAFLFWWHGWIQRGGEEVQGEWISSVFVQVEGGMQRGRMLYCKVESRACPSCIQMMRHCLSVCLFCACLQYSHHFRFPPHLPYTRILYEPHLLTPLTRPHLLLLIITKRRAYSLFFTYHRRLMRWCLSRALNCVRRATPTLSNRHHGSPRLIVTSSLHFPSKQSAFFTTTSRLKSEPEPECQ
jgi:hypothetical protein